MIIKRAALQRDDTKAWFYLPPFSLRIDPAPDSIIDIRRNPVTVDRSDDRPGATLVDIAASFNRLPESERRESEIVGFLGGLGAVSGNAIADEPSTDGVGVGVDSDIATEPAPAQRGDTATWHCVSIDGEPRNWITRPVLADMDELSIIVEEG